MKQAGFEQRWPICVPKKKKKETKERKKLKYEPDIV
jgi:hypothetical protein